MSAPTSKLRVAVAGASGYAGGELLRLVAAHPHLTLAAVTSEKSAGASVASVFPHLSHVVDQSFEALAPETLAERADAVLLALPHTKSFEAVSVCLKAGKHVVDLSADYRLRDAGAYPTWYEATHPYPDLLKQAVYGLPELHREAIKQARLVASPGCYPTAAILQLAPLCAEGVIDPSTLVIDAKSGVSGAGRSPALPYHFPEAHESLEPYKIGTHRHIPEIEQELTLVASRHTDASPSSRMAVSFTPHLVPMNRGILSTAYAKLKTGTDVRSLRELYAAFYKHEPFVRVQSGDRPANPGHVRGSNYCDLSVHLDRRTGWVITVAALDNLVKGAAGQALQALNLMLDIPEETGLRAPGVFP
ncbi:N-acetyl-gamma-glutamyl-phosphate reductase [Nitrospira sp.]|nr:N-acetyl-gamma-glutamyl-phosphate reductase [Nitrospira sp.]